MTLEHTSHFSERIEIKNLINIKYAIIEPKRLNILIGNNASGKSLIVKAVHILRDFAKNILNITILKQITSGSSALSHDELESMKNLFIDNFIKIFHIEYIMKTLAVQDNSMELLYSANNLELIRLEITYKDTKNPINFIINHDKFLQLIDESKISTDITEQQDTTSVLLNLKDSDNISSLLFLLSMNFGSLNVDLKQFEKLEMLSGMPLPIKDLFIPYARIMFLYIDFLSIEKRYERFDPLTLSFIEFMEGLAEHIKRKLDTLIYSGNSQFQQLFEKYISLERDVLLANLKIGKESGKIQLEMNGQDFDLFHISSGQQELLPLLLTLRYALIFNKPPKKLTRIYIEEPETHLHPFVQKDLTRLLGFMYNQGTQFFITTHSPYLLSALNTLLLAYTTYQETGKEEIKEKYQDFWINPEHVSVYEVADGTAKPILDKEEGLITAERIDDVSLKIVEENDEILKMGYAK